MEKIEEFIIHLKENHSRIFKSVLEDYSIDPFVDIHTINDDIYNDLIDAFNNYILDKCEHVNGEDIKHEGGDESAYENGVYHTQLFEIHGFYFWQTAEGETYGLFKSEADAYGFSYFL